MPAERPKLFLLDTFGLIFRAYYGRARASGTPFRTSSGQPTEAIRILETMLNSLFDRHQPNFVVAVWEGQGPTFREEIFPAYKANRDQTPDDLVAQLPFIKRLLAARNIPVLSEDGYEADDTIGLLAAQAVRHGLDVWIISSDKDLMQLVREGVSMLNPMKDARYESAEVEDFLGVKPAHVTDLLALRGDAVDNIPGAPGIGEKGAQQLIARYGDIEEIIRHAEEVSRKAYRESLQNHADQIRLSKRLASLDTSGSLQLDLEAARHGEPDKPRLRELYLELEFRSLASKLDEPSAPPPETAERAFESAEDFADWLGQAEQPVAIAVMRSDSDGTSELGFSAKPEEAWKLPAELVPAAMATLEASGRSVCVHDWKSAAHALAADGAGLACVGDDTMLLEFLADSSRTDYSLGKAVERRFAVRRDWSAASAADYTRRLQEQLKSVLAEPDLRELYESIDLPLVPVLQRMEATGVLLDSSILDALSSQLQEEIAALGQEIHALAGRPFNIASPKQLGEVLYGDLGLPEPAKRGKTKTPSTASDILENLALRHPIAGKVLDWRKAAKLKSTYVDALPSLVQADRRLHTTFNPTGSATGRLSSLNPNLQNIPVRSERGREIRRAFVAEAGSLLVAADYSQIELRVLAHMSADPALLEAFRSGEDVHTRTAAEVLSVAPELVAPADRSKAKAVNFGIIYGLSAFGLAKQLRIPQSNARKYIDLYFARYEGVDRFIAATIERTKEAGYSRTLFGRRRPVPDLESKNPTARGFAERIAVNSPIQGTAADLIKKAMVAVDASLRREGLKARMLLQVHDELVVEAPEAEVAAVSALLKRDMEAAADLAVPLVVDIKTGPNWLDMQPLER